MCWDGNLAGGEDAGPWPSLEWRGYIIRPDFLGAVFGYYAVLRASVLVPGDVGGGGDGDGKEKEMVQRLLHQSV